MGPGKTQAGRLSETFERSKTTADLLFAARLSLSVLSRMSCLARIGTVQDCSATCLCSCCLPTLRWEGAAAAVAQHSPLVPRQLPEGGLEQAAACVESDW